MLTTKQLTVNNQGVLAGGDIAIVSGSLTLDNEAAISAKTKSPDGSNIKLQVADILLMRRGSKISAAEAEGEGGKSTIDARFIVAVPSENSDIIANQVEVTVQGILGIEFRTQLTPLSDIVALGATGFNTPNPNPFIGLPNLPKEMVTTEISQSCQTVRGKEAVAYFEIGRGGSPPTPDEPLNADAALEDWIDLELKSNNGSDSGTTIHSPHPTKTQLISPCPAQ